MNYPAGMRRIALIALVFLFPVSGRANASGGLEHSASGVRHRLAQVRSTLHRGADTQVTRRAARKELAELGQAIRTLDRGAERTALTQTFQQLSEEAFEQRHGLGRQEMGRLRALEGDMRQQTPISQSGRRWLAPLIWSLRRDRRRHTARLRQRLDHAVGQAQFERGVSLGRLGLESSIELEIFEITKNIIQNLELAIGDGTIAELLKRGEKVLEVKARREAPGTAMMTVAQAQAIKDAAPSADWRHQTLAVQEAEILLARADLEKDYARSLDTIEKLAAKLQLDEVSKLTWAQLVEAADKGVKIGRGKARRVVGWSVLSSLVAGAVVDGDWDKSRDLEVVRFRQGAQTLHVPRRIIIDGEAISGRVEADLGIGPLVQFGSRRASRVLDGVELHRRKKGITAGQNSFEAFSIVNQGLLAKMKHQHVHMPFFRRRHQRVGKSRRALEVGAPSQGLMLADAHRVMSIGMELRRVGAGTALRVAKDERDTYGDYSTAKQSQRIHRHLTGELPMKGEGIKATSNGYRIGLYGDSALDGIEARLISVRNASIREGDGWRGKPPATSSSPEYWVPRLNAMQKMLGTAHYYLLPEQMERWFRTIAEREGEAPVEVASEGLFRAMLPQFIRQRRRRTLHHTALRKVEVSQRAILGRLHYNRSLEDLLARLPSHVKDVLTPAVQRLISEGAKKNYALKMLLHDWRQDTVWADMRPKARQKAQERVMQAQVAALRSLEHPSAKPTRALATFVQDSDLRRVFDRAQGLPVESVDKQ